MKIENVQEGYLVVSLSRFEAILLAVPGGMMDAVCQSHPDGEHIKLWAGEKEVLFFLPVSVLAQICREVPGNPNEQMLQEGVGAFLATNPGMERCFFQPPAEMVGDGESAKA